MSSKYRWRDFAALPDGDTYRIAQHAAGDIVFRPKSMKGLKVDLENLWQALEQ